MAKQMAYPKSKLTSNNFLEVPGMFEFTPEWLCLFCLNRKAKNGGNWPVNSDFSWSGRLYHCFSISKYLVKTNITSNFLYASQSKFTSCAPPLSTYWHAIPYGHLTNTNRTKYCNQYKLTRTRVKTASATLPYLHTTLKTLCGTVYRRWFRPCQTKLSS